MNISQCLGCNGTLGILASQMGQYHLYCQKCNYTYYALEDQSFNDPYYEFLESDNDGLPTTMLKQGHICKCLLFRGVSDCCSCNGDSEETSDDFESKPRVTPDHEIYYFDANKLSCCGPVGSYNGSCIMFWQGLNGELLSDTW